MKKLMVTGGLGFIGSYFVELAFPPSHKASAFIRLRRDMSAFVQLRRDKTADREGFVLSFQ